MPDVTDYLALLKIGRTG